MQIKAIRTGEIIPQDLVEDVIRYILNLDLPYYISRGVLMHEEGLRTFLMLDFSI